MTSANDIRGGGAVVELSTKDSALMRGLRNAQARVAGFAAFVKSTGLTMGGSIGSSLSKGFGTAQSAIGSFGKMLMTTGPTLASVLSSGKTKLVEFGGSLKAGLSILNNIAKSAGVAGMALTAMGAVSMKVFANTDKRLLTPAEAEQAQKMKDGLEGLKQSALQLNAAFQTALAPAFNLIVDSLRLGMNAMRDWLRENKDLIQSSLSFLTSIRNALAAGDIKLAAEILWQGIKVAWLAGIDAIYKPWTEWKTSFQQTAAEAFLGVIKIAGDAWRALRMGARKTGDFIEDSFSGASYWIAEKFIDALEAAGKYSKKEADDIRKELHSMEGEDARAKQRARAERDQDIEKERQQADRDFGETVLDVRRSIAAANNADLERAHQDYAKSLEELNRLKKQADAKNPGELAKPMDLEKAKKTAEEKVNVIGSFSAVAARGIGRNNKLNEVAQNTKDGAEASKETVAILEEIRDNIGVKFA